jgi:hypothetical protein
MTSGELAYLAEGAMRDYVPSLAKYLTDSAAKGVVDAIVKARREGTGSPGVLREIEPLFSPERAARIAVTETTKLFGAGAQAVYDAQGVQFWLWSTVKDPWVCSRCAEREGHRYSVALDDFEPLHVRCRCFPRPDHDKESLPGAELTDPYHRELATAEFQRMFPDAVRTGTGAPDLMLREWARSNGIDLFVSPDAVSGLTWPKAERIAQGISRAREAMRTARSQITPDQVHWEIRHLSGTSVADQRRESPNSAVIHVYEGHPAARSIPAGEAFIKQQVEEGWWPKGTRYVDIIVHEAGHASEMDGGYNLFNRWEDVFPFFPVDFALIRKDVSGYATRNPHEFVAEMFAILTRTSPAQMNPKLINLYKNLGGVIPEVLPP